MRRPRMGHSARHRAWTPPRDVVDAGAMPRARARRPLRPLAANADATGGDLNDDGIRAHGDGDGDSMDTRSVPTPEDAGVDARAVGDENTPPVFARAASGKGGGSRSVDGCRRADAAGERRLNSPSRAKTAEKMARAWDERRSARAMGGKPMRGDGTSDGGSSWKEEMTRTRERLARSRELSAFARAGEKEKERASEGEDEDGRDVVEALERRLDGAVVASPDASSSVRDIDEGAALEGESEDDEDEANASFASPNLDDPTVAVAVERTRLLSERKSREVTRKLVVSNEHNARLKARVSELELTLEDKQNEIENTERRVQSAVKEATREVWAKMDAANTQCVRAETSLVEAKAEAQDAMRRAIELESRLEQSERALSEARASQKRADDDLVMLRELASEASDVASKQLEDELAQARAEIERLTTRLDEVQETANEKIYYQSESERMEQELEELRNEVSWRKASETELRAALERSEGEIVLHRAESSKSESDVFAVIEAKNAENDELRRLLAAAETRAAANEASTARAMSEVDVLRAQKVEFESALQCVTVDGSVKQSELEKEYAAAMLSMQDLASSLEEVQYELKQTRVEKERALVEAQDARRAVAEAASLEEYKRVDLTTELETALEYNDHLQQELVTMRERERDLLSQLDDALIAAQLADEETEVDVDSQPESEDPSTPSPVKNARARASSSGSRKMNVANLVATNRDLVELTSRQSNEISRLQAERSKLRADITKSESAHALVRKLKDENFALACKFKATLQKTSDEIKARQQVESRLHEHERAAHGLERTIDELRGELMRVRETHPVVLETSPNQSSVIDELRKELAEVKETLSAVKSEEKATLECLSAQLKQMESAHRREEAYPRARRNATDASFADYLAHEVAQAEAAEADHDAYARRLQEEIDRVTRERAQAEPRPRSSASVPSPERASPERGEAAMAAAKEATELALEVCESTKERALYYKSVAKQVYGKLREQKLSYERKLASMKRELDALVASTDAPATPSLRTPISAIARDHKFLLDST